MPIFCFTKCFEKKLGKRPPPLAFVSLSRFLFKWEKLFNFVRTEVTEAWFILTRLNAGPVKHLDIFPLMGFYFEQLIPGSLAFTEKTQNTNNSNVESPINNMCQQTSPINLHLNLHLTFRRNRWRYLWFSSSILTGMQQSNRLLVLFQIFLQWDLPGVWVQAHANNLHIIYRLPVSCPGPL